MHLLAAQPGGFTDEEGIVDLEQTPAAMVILSSQDTSLGLLADTLDNLPSAYPEVRLANLVHIAKPAAYDLYEHKVLQHCKLIVVSLLGGKSYWPYGIEQLQILAKDNQISLIIVPGDDQVDEELLTASSCSAEQHYAVWRYLREGGSSNARSLFRFLAANFPDTREPFLNKTSLGEINPPIRVPETQVYFPEQEASTFDQWKAARNPDLPTAILLFYRSHIQSGNTQAFDQLIKVLEQRLNVLAVSTLSLKNAHCLSTVNFLIDESDCSIIINTTSFSQHIEGNANLSSSPQSPQQLFDRDLIVIQAILAANSEADWLSSDQGLRSRDIAMNIALPEFDGRIISRAITFKSLLRHSESAQLDVIRYQLQPERAAWLSELSANWASLRTKPNEQKKIALILANYPTRDGRIGNGVGLDTPASTINILKHMKTAGFDVHNIPENGDLLIDQLQRGVTNNLDTIVLKAHRQSIPLSRYESLFSRLPETNQQQIIERWGPVQNDPFFRNGEIIISGIQLGATFVGIQPARGFNVDVVANYHDPDLVPPHGYIAFYIWLRHEYKTDAIAHIGKHGNLEWLPGKSVALSKNCWPDLVLGPLPHLYPFIVNDPGEGSQAKRRAQAVILDHLMPPMARAETYGDLLELENWVDEYYQALGLDPKRENFLRQTILKKLTDSHLIEELNILTAEVQEPENSDSNSEDLMLNQLDTYLCDLKEAQIRHGLHRFGQLPDSQTISETLVALTRLPRGEHENDRGILHCLSQDLDLENEKQSFDPLRINPAKAWSGNQPDLLRKISSTSWRTEADTRERLELLAEDCINKLLMGEAIDNQLGRTQRLLTHVDEVILNALTKSAEDEVQNFVGALCGKFVPAGPSGAPTRGRLDVLPTGRNFYSLDSRSIPTRSAWALGLQSADALVKRHLQEQGDYPEYLGISVWGTSTMRTGGDDIAQALALMGVKPVWSEGSNRVTDIEIIPGFQLGRPRVDVTLRISGFFRDAFPNVAGLFDVAVQALSDYEEPGDSNTIRQHVLDTAQSLTEEGLNRLDAHQQSRIRIFGSKPGSYGAGLQGLIDEGIWKDSADLAQAYVNWGGYSYTQAAFGKAAFRQFEKQLGKLEVVVQNQDNREHDLLDSDDYYQFQGGMSNAVEVLKGQQPTIYHADHSNPADPKIGTLKEELNRVIRSRVINPKWISAMQNHGYKGAFEMAASVDYVFAYDATTGLIDDYQYESVTEALVLDEHNQQFLENSNPNALKEMAERLLEAQQRGLWSEPGNYKGKLTDIILKIDNSLETAQE